MAFDFACNNAQSVREMCAGTYKTEAALQALVIAAIYAQIAANESFSCTQSVTGYSGQDVQRVMGILTDQNFTVSLSGSTMTISW